VSNTIANSHSEIKVLNLGLDLKLAVRVAVRAPMFSLMVALTLAVGLGASTAMFSVLDAVLLRPLPYRDAGRLVVISTADAGATIAGQPGSPASYPTIADWRARSAVFENVAFSSVNLPVTFDRGDGPQRADGALVSDQFFEVLGARPYRGRFITADELARGSGVVVVSFAFWREELRGDDHAVGQLLSIDGRDAIIIGVAPPSFHFPQASTAVWRPLRSSAISSRLERDRNGRVGVAVARLRPGLRVDGVQRELDRVAAGLAADHPELARDPDFAGFRATALSITQYLVAAPVRVTLIALLAAVIALLVIGCANVAGLLMARGTSRQQEIAVRQALGASRGRIVFQLLIESILISLVGGAAGVAFAGATVRIFAAVAPATVPNVQLIRLDGRAVAFATALSLVTGVLFGLVPAWRATGRSSSEFLRAGSRAIGGHRAQHRMSSAIIAAQMTLTVVLLCGATAMIESLSHLRAVRLGFDPDSVVILRVVQGPGKSPAQQAAFVRDAIDAIRGLPTVRAAGAISELFLAANPDAAIRVEGPPPPSSVLIPVIDAVVSPSFFTSLVVPLRSGRSFSMGDGMQSPRVALVNETLARLYWPNAPAVGKRFRFADGRFGDTLVTVVGVVGDMRRNGLNRSPMPQVFLPSDQLPSRGNDIVVRADPLSTALVPAIRRALGALDKAAPVYRVSMLSERLAGEARPMSFQALLLGFFAIGALLLVAIGTHGLLDYFISQRIGEIGLRLALGATRLNVIAMVAVHAAEPALAGVALGATLAVLSLRLARSVLFDVSASDPLTLLVAPTATLAVIGVATALPALRAGRLKPAIALREG
jgi:putative ABC transport system permease protein